MWSAVWFHAGVTGCVTVSCYWWGYLDSRPFDWGLVLYSTLGLVRLIWNLFCVPELVHAILFYTYQDWPWKQRAGSEGMGNIYSKWVAVNLTSTPQCLQIWWKLGDLIMVTMCWEVQVLLCKNSQPSTFSKSESRRYEVKIQRPQRAKNILHGLVPFWESSPNSFCLFDLGPLYVYEYVCASKAPQLMQVIRVANQSRPVQTPSCAL